VEVRPHRIREALDQGKVVIVAGYQGVSRAREVTTLGRGGSDTTAVALAAALGVERCEILSDVDGVFTADPRVVPEARRRDAFEYGEMQDLATWGAKVLNAEAVEFARQHGIVIHAGLAHGDGAGTRIVSHTQEAGLAAGVALAPELALATLDGPADVLLARCAACGVAPISMRWADGRTVAVLSLQNLHSDSLARTEGVSWREDLAAATAVGRRLLVAGGVAAALSALAREGIAVCDVDASDVRATFFVSKGAGAQAARVLHAVLVAPAKEGAA
jgi:aspartate kinase